MKRFLRLFVFVIAAFSVLTSAVAFAADIKLSNNLDVKVSITLSYYEEDSGTLVTKGWWHVDPGSEKVISVNADTSKDMYYAAYNKVQFRDSSTSKNQQIRRWASPSNFTFSGEEEPDESSCWNGRFYKFEGDSINIDEAPYGN